MGKYRNILLNEEVIMTIELGILISIGSIFIAGLGVFVAFLTYQSKKSTATRSDTKESAELKAGVDYIRKGVDDIRIDLKANERQINQMNTEIVRVDESVKSAHKRIDKFEGIDKK